MSAHAYGVTVEEMDEAKAHRAFEAKTLAATGLTRQEFLSKLDAGEFDRIDTDDVVTLRMLAPFGR